MLNGRRAEAEPGETRGSLRSELLLRLGVLAAAALVFALSIGSLVWLLRLPPLPAAALLALLVVLDVAVFLAMGSHLVHRLVLRPLSEAVDAAGAIATGDYARRVPPGRTRETAALAAALNDLTDQLLLNQQRLAENVSSLDQTNRLLNEAQRELIQVEKMASIGRLAAGIAHEVGNPLGALLGYVGVLRRRQVQPELLDGIEREARRIDQIVRGLLDYARPGAAARERLDVNDSVRRMVDLLRAQGRLQTVEVRLDLADPLPEVEGVPHRLDQLFLNLFANAEAAMQGVGRLTVVTRCERYRPEREIPIRRADDPPGVNYSHLRRLRFGAARDARLLQSESETVRVVVADTGPGIDPDHIDLVFEPFFTTKAPGDGTGLGLAIVAGTVAELGGRIEVSSAAGGGATFNLFLPTAPA